MIVRVFRAKVRPGKREEFELNVRQLSIPLVRSQNGLIAFFSGRPIEPHSDEFVMVTVWEDLDALIAFAGDDWSASVIPEPERPLLIETLTNHYELIDGSNLQSIAAVEQSARMRETKVEH